MSEEPFILPCSILENIILDQRLNTDKLNWCLKYSLFEDDLVVFLDGLDTLVGTIYSRQLTIGQEIRLSLARCLYRNSDVLFLDSIFNSLDLQSTNFIIEETLLKQLSKKTRILVTNNYNLVKKCDRVILMNDGEICLDGSYQTVQKSPHFQDIKRAWIEEESTASLTDRQELEALIKKNLKDKKKIELRKMGTFTERSSNLQFENRESLKNRHGAILMSETKERFYGDESTKLEYSSLQKTMPNFRQNKSTDPKTEEADYKNILKEMLNSR